MTVTCSAAPPQLPDAVRQNNNQITLNRTTVINWQPATVNFGSDNVTYTVTSNLDPVDFNTTTTTATVVLPAFNTDYSFCVDSINTCGETSGTPRCATPPVRIEAEGTYATPSWHSCSIIGEAYKFLRDTE